MVELGDGGIVACGGYAHHGQAIELKHVYVDASARRRGIARRLVERAEREARSRGCRLVELWSDSRFEGAHRFYEGLGYERLPGRRLLGDLSDSAEYAFTKLL